MFVPNFKIIGEVTAEKSVMKNVEKDKRAILVEGHSRNIPVKLFQNPLTGLGGDVF